MIDSEQVKVKYNKIAKVYDLLEKPMETMMMDKWRQRLIEAIEGVDVLEVGVGTGNSLLYYPENLRVIGIDFSKNMLEKASKKIEGKSNIKLLEMDVQSMGFADNTFDTVITSCVFCSVPDPVKGLKEIRRVCKNNGKILMLEHVRSKNELIGKLMDAVNFIPVNIWGANINRRTIENLLGAGFKSQDIVYEDIWSDIVKFIEIRNRKNNSFK